MMAPEEILSGRVRQIQMRCRLLVVQRWVCDALVVSAGVCAVLVILTRTRLWPDAVDYLWAPALAAVLAGLGWGLTRTITAPMAAQIADERAELKERLSTAVELMRRSDRTEIANAQIQDAALAAQGVKTAEVLPWRLPPRGRLLGLATVAVALLYYLPTLPLFQSQQQRADRAVMKLEGERIQKIAKELEKKAAEKPKDDENAEIMRKVSREMARLGKDQTRDRVDKKQALLKLNELQKQLKQAENKARGETAPKSMEAAAKQLQQAAEASMKSGSPEAAQALKQMAKSLSQKDMTSAQKQLEDLARRLQEGKVKPEELKQISDAMAQMAASMKDTKLDQASDELKDAAQKLQQALKSTGDLQEKMQQAKSDAERQQLQQQMQQQLSEAMKSASAQANKAGGT